MLYKNTYTTSKFNGHPLNKTKTNDFYYELRFIHRTLTISLRMSGHSREIKFDVTWSYVKRQTAKMKLLPSVFSSLNSRVKIFVFVAISRRHFSIFM